MVDEAAATGRVAGVYGAILEQLPMVPSLFKSLAVCPGYLELAWAQADGILGADGFAAAARRSADRVAGAVPAPADPALREVLGRFVDPLARMLLVTAGLRAALAGTLSGPPAEPDSLPAPPRLAPELDIPSTDELDPALVGAIRRDLGTPIVNSVWRLAAARGVLASAWEHLGAVAGTDAFAGHAAAVAEDAARTAAALPWSVVASPAALAQRHLDDAAPGVGAILDAYLATLPSVLTLVASSRGGA